MIADRPGSIDRGSVERGDFVLAQDVKPLNVPPKQVEKNEKPSEKRTVFPRLALILDLIEHAYKNGADMPGAQELVLTTADIRDVPFRMIKAVNWWLMISFLMMFAAPIAVISLAGGIETVYPLAYASSVIGALIMIIQGWMVYSAEAFVMGPKTGAYWRGVIGVWRTYELGIWFLAISLAVLMWVFSARLEGYNYGEGIYSVLSSVFSWLFGMFNHAEWGVKLTNFLVSIVHIFSKGKPFLFHPFGSHMLQMVLLSGGLYSLCAYGAKQSAKKKHIELRGDRERKIDVDVFPACHRALYGGFDRTMIKP